VAGKVGPIELVDGVLADLETCALSDPEKALFRFVRKINFDSVSIGPADIEALHLVGYDDEAIYYALTVCALFNFYNRWIDVSGVHAMSDDSHRAGARRSAQHGYSRSSQPAPTTPPK
jgi:alkylhydroperoxidase family enzyme